MKYIVLSYFFVFEQLAYLEQESMVFGARSSANVQYGDIHLIRKLTKKRRANFFQTVAPF